MEGGRKFLTSKLNQTTHLNSTNIPDFFNNAYLFIIRKLSEITHLIPNLTSIPVFFNDVHLFTARVFVFDILPVALLLLCFYRFCCRCCCCCCSVRLGSCFRRYLCCSCGEDCLGRRRFGPMMRAPGRHGRRMPRSSFEGNPRSYFKDLRAKKELCY